MKELEKVIVALDFDNTDKAFRLIDDIGDKIQRFKIGPVLFLLNGKETISFLHRRSKKIFLDLKLHDTPQAIGDTIKQIGDLGVEFTTIHCMGGLEMCQAASANCRGTQLKLLGISLLTSEARPVQEDNVKAVLDFVTLAHESRLAGIVCSPHEVRAMKQRALPGFLHFVAGIRIKGQEVFGEDQKRVAQANDALSEGADFLIVGRPIAQARNPRLALDQLFIPNSGF